MKDIKLLSKNKYLKVPLLYSDGGGDVPEWRRHLQPCEWISGKSGPYIYLNEFVDFDILTAKIECKCSLLNNSANAPIFGSATSSQRELLKPIVIRGERQIRCDFCDEQIILDLFDNIELIVVIDNQQYIIKDFDGNIINSHQFSFSGQYHIVTQPFVLFAANNYGTVTQGKLNGRMSYFKAETSRIDINLLSCYVIDTYTDNKGNLCSAGVPGMVDVLSGVFHTNDGTGAFSHGGPIEIEF